MDIRKFEVEVKLAAGGKREYEYRNEHGRVSSELEVRDAQGRKTKQADPTAERLLVEIAPVPGMEKDELLRRARAALQLSDDSRDRLEVEVEFADGAQIEAEDEDDGKD